MRNVSFMEYQRQYVESTEVIWIVGPACKGEGNTSNQEEMNQTKNSDIEKVSYACVPSVLNMQGIYQLCCKNDH